MVTTLKHFQTLSANGSNPIAYAITGELIHILYSNKNKEIWYATGTVADPNGESVTMSFVSPKDRTKEQISNFLSKVNDGVTYKGTTYTTTQIISMREWAKECQWREDDDNSFIDDLSDMDILRAIDRHFDGGLSEAITCLTPTTLSTNN